MRAIRAMGTGPLSRDAESSVGLPFHFSSETGIAASAPTRRSGPHGGRQATVNAEPWSKAEIAVGVEADGSEAFAGRTARRPRRTAQVPGHTLVDHSAAIVIAATPRFRRGRRGGEPPRPLPLPGLPTGMTTIITNAYDNSCACLQIRRTCAARCAIGPRDGAYGGAFARVMCRRATHWLR